MIGFCRLEELTLTKPALSDEEVAALSRSLPALRRLTLGGGALGSHAPSE